MWKAGKCYGKQKQKRVPSVAKTEVAAKPFAAALKSKTSLCGGELSRDDNISEDAVQRTEGHRQCLSCANKSHPRK